MLEDEPTYATQLGVHAYDNRLADMSWGRIEAWTRRVEQFQRRLGGFAPGRDLEWAIDLALMRAFAGRQARGMRDLDLAHRNPDLYLGEALFGPYMLLMKDFAPLPQRAADLAGRLGDVPGVLAAAQANLHDVPGVWVQIAHQSVGGALGLFQNLIPAVAAQLEATHPLLAAQVRTTNDQAITALHGFAHFLETHVREAPDSAFAVGTAIWNAKVREEQMLDLDADQIEA